METKATLVGPRSQRGRKKLDPDPEVIDPPAVRLHLVAALLFASVACSATPVAPKAPPPDLPAPPTLPDDGDGGAPDTVPAARVRTFDDAKRDLARIYRDHPVDLYCGCPFTARSGGGFAVDLARCGYQVAHDAVRAGRIEWEHAVPAAALGRHVSAWRDGDPRCKDGKGKPYHGRSCARVASPAFARMEGDMHNLFPVVGEVNALRSDLPMGLPLESAPSRGSSKSYRFGQCGSTIEPGFFLPRKEARGALARAHKYMNATYPEAHVLDDAHRALFDRWDAEDPPDAWERERNVRIEAIQGNANPFVR